MQMNRVLTHEIMNGIAPVTSIAETLCARYNGTETYITDGLAAISESTRSLRNFVERYNRITRLPHPEPTDFDPVPLIRQTITLAHTLPRGADALITLTLPATAPQRPLTLHADAGQLQQVILNLLKNALEASATRIDITLGLTRPDALAIQIQNNGNPIPADRAEIIFTPFFTTHPGGSGIGLSLSRRLIHQNHGTLLLTTPSPTTFTITLNLKS